MVHRGFCDVNSRSTSQALSKVVEVAQGVFLTTTFGFDFEVKERPPILTDRSRLLDFALPVIDTVLVRFIILTSHHFCNPHVNSRLGCWLIPVKAILSLPVRILWKLEFALGSSFQRPPRQKEGGKALDRPRA